MTITTPSGYEANFIDSEELSYGEKRKIQRIIFKQTRASYTDTDIIFDSQEEIAKIVLKSVKVGDKLVTENVLDEIMTWKNVKDGEAIMAEVAKYIDLEKIFGVTQEQVDKKK